MGRRAGSGAGARARQGRSTVAECKAGWLATMVRSGRGDSPRGPPKKTRTAPAPTYPGSPGTPPRVSLLRPLPKPAPPRAASAAAPCVGSKGARAVMMAARARGVWRGRPTRGRRRGPGGGGASRGRAGGEVVEAVQV